MVSVMRFGGLMAAFVSQAAACGGSVEKDSHGPAPTNAVDPLPRCNPDSSWRGDERCLPPLAAAAGFSLHYGPDSYSDAAAARFLLEPGAERIDCVTLDAPRAETAFVERWQARARPGTYNFSVLAGAPGIDPCRDARARLLLVSTDEELDLLVGDAPELVGSAIRVAAGEPLGIQLHAINIGETPLLREVWVNAYTRPAASVSRVVDTFAWIAPPEPNAVSGVHSRPSAELTMPARTELLAISGTLHVYSAALSAWVGEGSDQKLLFSMRFTSQRHFFRFDSVRSNPLPNLPDEPAGAWSGPVVLPPGTPLRFDCQYDAPDSWNEQPQHLAVTPCALMGWYAPSTGHWVSSDAI